MWARTEGQAATGYSPLHSRPDAARAGGTPCLASPTISASLVTQERSGPVAGQWFSERTYFFNLSLTGRPASARGRFQAMAGEDQPVGDLFVLPPGQRYLARGGPGRQCTLFVEMADPGLTEEQLPRLDSPALLRRCMNLPLDRLRDLAARMAREVREPGFASTLMLEGLGVTLLAETLRTLRQAEAGSGRRGGLAPWRLHLIEARVREVDGAPSLAELADLCGLSRRHLVRAFREETGQTIGAFVQSHTLDRAKALLTGTELPIGEIAVRVGFATPAAFATAFRRALGHSPRAYRASRGSA